MIEELQLNNSVLTAYFDGAIDRNPGGTATFGYRIYRDDEEIASGSGIVMEGPGATVNVAEYGGLYSVIEAIALHRLNGEKVVVYGDSKVVINGFIGGHTEHSPHLSRMSAMVRENWTRPTTLKWIPREGNKADDLAEGALRQNGPPLFEREDLYPEIDRRVDALSENQTNISETTKEDILIQELKTKKEKEDAALKKEAERNYLKKRIDIELVEVMRRLE